jgi:hypothetical protein
MAKICAINGTMKTRGRGLCQGAVMALCALVAFPVISWGQTIGNSGVFSPLQPLPRGWIPPAQQPSIDSPRPQAPGATTAQGSPASFAGPGGGIGAPPVSAAPVAPMAAPAGPANPPVVPSGQIALMLSARYGADAPYITAGLQWRVYADRPDPSGIFRLVKEDKSAAPTFVLPAGGYVVHVGFGLANAVRRIQLRSDSPREVREVFELAAGGAHFEGRVGDSKIPPGQISFDIFRGSQFEPGEKRPIVRDMSTADFVLLPEGTYYVVSNYGDGNAVVRSDIRIQAGKLTDVSINHRAAVITLKLVGAKGGEALANTTWSVLTPGGDVIKETIGAFPKVILAEGDYVAIARNEGKVYNQDFKVEPGLDREIEVVAQ